MDRWLPIWVLLAGASALGCSRDIEEDCKMYCAWADDCGELPPDCVENCVENAKKASDDCRDAHADFVDCVEEEPACSLDECDDETLAFFAHCVDEFE